MSLSLEQWNEPADLNIRSLGEDGRRRVEAWRAWAQRIGVDPIPPSEASTALCGFRYQAVGGEQVTIDLFAVIESLVRRIEALEADKDHA